MTAPSQPAGGGTVTFLTVAEVADHLRVSKMTVYRAIHMRELTAARIGRSFRVPEQAMNEWLASGTGSGS